MNKIKIFKLILLIAIILMLIGVTIQLLPLIKNLSTKEGQIIFKNKITNSGIGGFLFLLSLQIAQIFLVFLPGEPIEIIAGMCYGSFWGTVFIIISSSIISTIIFCTVKKYGRRIIFDFYNEEKVRKIENSKMFQNSKKVELIMFILFLIPGTPKDLLVYLFGLLPIKTIHFIILTTVARIPSIVSSTIAGENFLNR